LTAPLRSLLFLALILLATAVAAAWSAGHLDNAARADPLVSPDDDPSWGPADAPVTIVEFGDYQCPFCKLFWDQTFPQIQATYEGVVRFVYRDFPLTSIHPYAQKAAEASECADDQGHFWEYHALLWADQQELDVASLKAYAAQLGLDTATFDDCLDSGKNAQEVQKDYSDGVSYGVQGSPWFFVNDEELPGAQPFSEFQTAIDNLLGVTPTPTATPTTEPEGQLHNCPSANRWSIAVWSGSDGVATEDALATCSGVTVEAAYWLDPQTQGWLRYFRGLPEVTSLQTLDDLQGVLALGGAAISLPPSHRPRPRPRRPLPFTSSTLGRGTQSSSTAATPTSLWTAVPRRQACSPTSRIRALRTSTCSSPPTLTPTTSAASQTCSRNTR
jgi:protein-disulfide isomerase